MNEWSLSFRTLHSLQYSRFYAAKNVNDVDVEIVKHQWR